jgi:anhydro-N-acetylmuramic acid kinase
MSGTSLDGLDIALARFSGFGSQTQVEVLQHTTVSFADGFRAQIREVFAKQHVSLPYLTLLNRHIALTHGAIVNQVLDDWQIDRRSIALVASHGQTVMHTPFHQHHIEAFSFHATLQLGDGDQLSVLCGIPVLSDFRQKHIAAGGEGAPLALYGDYLLFRNQQHDRFLLNLGGIANFTYLPADDTTPPVSTDCGPANTILDSWLRLHQPDLLYDTDGRLAEAGSVHQALLTALLDHEFFKLPLPKTSGPELFNTAYFNRAQAKTGATTLSLADQLATLCAFSAESVARAIHNLSPRGEVLVSGGGLHHPVLMAQLIARLGNPYTVQPLSVLGIAPDAKEAVLFATLANEWLGGLPASCGSNTAPTVLLGKLSLPM